MCVDNNQERLMVYVEACPIYEPARRYGIEQCDCSRLSFNTDVGTSIADAEVVGALLWEHQVRKMVPPI